MRLLTHAKQVQSRRNFLRMTALLAISKWSSGLIGCGGQRPLSIASHVWPGYEFMFLAENLGWLNANAIRLIPTPNASVSLKMLSEGQALGAALTLDEALSGIAQGLPLSIVLLFDLSVGADKVLVKPHIKNFAALRGARIGVENTALGALMLKKLLYTANLAQQEIKLVQIPNNNPLQLWQTAAVDALISYEPIASKLQAQGARIIFDSRSIPNSIFDVLVLRRDALKRYANQLRMLISAHFRALHEWQTNPVDTQYRLTKRLAVEVANIPELYHGLQLPDLEYNRHLLTSPALELHSITAELITILNLKQTINTPELFQADYLPEQRLQ